MTGPDSGCSCELCVLVRANRHQAAVIKEQAARLAAQKDDRVIGTDLLPAAALVGVTLALFYAEEIAAGVRRLTRRRRR